MSAPALPRALLVTRAEAAEYLAVSTKEIDRMRRAGTILAKKRGRNILIPVTELTRYVDSLPWDEPRG